MKHDFYACFDGRTLKGNTDMFGQHIPPLPPEHYVARIDAEKELREHLLGNDDRPLTILYGDSETGKSTLAARIAQSLQAENSFPDGVFWITLPEPMLGNSLLKLLRMFDSSVPDTPQFPKSQLHSALWSALERRRVLFILDDVKDGKTISDLLLDGSGLEDQYKHPVIRSRLRRILSNTLNEGELHDLCFDLGMDYDLLSNSGKGDKIRNLIEYHYRHDTIFHLVMQYRQIRSNQELSCCIPGHCRILAVSKQRVKELPLSHHETELTFFSELECFDLFKKYLEPDLFTHYYDCLPSIAKQNGYRPKLIEIAARDLRNKKPSLYACEKNSTPQKPTSITPGDRLTSSQAVTSSGENLQPITMYVSKAQIQGLWRDDQEGDENTVGR